MGDSLELVNALGIGTGRPEALKYRGVLSIYKGLCEVSCLLKLYNACFADEMMREAAKSIDRELLLWEGTYSESFSEVDKIADGLKRSEEKLAKNEEKLAILEGNIEQLRAIIQERGLDIGE